MWRASGSSDFLEAYDFVGQPLALCSSPVGVDFDVCEGFSFSLWSSGVPIVHSVVSGPLRLCGLLQARLPPSTVPRSLFILMSMASMVPSSHLILCCPLLGLPSVFPSIRVFSSVSALCIRWPKCWSFSFSISPSNEYLGMISFRIDKFDVLAVQRTLESLLQHHR